MSGYELRYRQVDGLSPEELAARLRRSYSWRGWQMGELRRDGDGAVETVGFWSASSKRKITIRVQLVQGAEKEVCIAWGNHHDAHGKA